MIMPIYSEDAGDDQPHVFGPVHSSRVTLFGQKSTMEYIESLPLPQSIDEYVSIFDLNALPCDFVPKTAVLGSPTIHVVVNEKLARVLETYATADKLRALLADLFNPPL